MSTLYVGTKFSGHDSSVYVIAPGLQQSFGLSTERVTRYKHDDIYPLDVFPELVNQLGTSVDEICRVVCCHAFSSDREAMHSADRYADRTDWREFLQANYFTELDSQIQRFSARPYWCRFPNLLLSAAGRRIVFRRARRALKPARKKKHRDVLEHALRNVFTHATVQVEYEDHEYCHALCALTTSGFRTGLVVAMDGCGDDGVWSRSYTICGDGLVELGSCQNFGRIIIKVAGRKISKHCSLGGIYSLVTFAIGLRVNSDEGKTEALAAYGAPIRMLYDALLEGTTIDCKRHSISLDERIIQRAIDDHVSSEESISESRSKDLAATAQLYLDTVVPAYIDHLISCTNSTAVALAGGLFANVVLNMHLFENVVDCLHITPAMGDDGSSQGAAIAARLRDNVAPSNLDFARERAMPYHGPAFSKGFVRKTLSECADIKVRDVGDAWPEYVAELLHRNETVAVFYGRMEWGPRALGNRSILVNATMPGGRAVVNERLKKRPYYQPVCPAILACDREVYFEKSYDNRHMTCAFRLRPEAVGALPSISHIDGTARPQFVHKSDNAHLWRILSRLKELSGHGVVLNTSFNVHGRAMVMSPHHAIDDFVDGGLDALLIEGYEVRSLNGVRRAPC